MVDGQSVLSGKIQIQTNEKKAQLLFCGVLNFQVLAI